MRFFAFLPLLASLVSAQSDISFISPAPGAAGKNFALNPTYVIGSRLLVRWTPTNETISLVMYQERPKDNFEYVFQNSKDISSFPWTIGTQKDLKNGQVFFFQIFIQGKTSPAASSSYFNLTRQGNDDSTTTTSSSTSSSTPTPTDSFTSSIASTTSGITPTPTNTSPPASGDSGGLSTGAKVGMGVGIPIAVILGVIAGWFFFGRKRKDPSEDYTSTIPPNHEAKYTPPGEGSYAPEAVQEQAGGYYKPQGSPNPPPSEMYAGNGNAPVEMPGQRYT